MTDQMQVMTPPGPGPGGGPPGPAAPLVTRIVPLAGLPIVGVILVFLVLSMANDWRWGLTFFHVAGEVMHEVVLGQPAEPLPVGDHVLQRRGHRARGQ